MTYLFSLPPSPFPPSLPPQKDNGETIEQVVRARGHLDEVMEIRVPHVAANQVLEVSKNTELLTLTLMEGQVLGGGAFSRVSVVTELSTGRQYAMKRMKKIAVMQCPDHVFCEQAITRNISHPFCIRQYSSFQVGNGTHGATHILCRLLEFRMLGPNRFRPMS